MLPKFLVFYGNGLQFSKTSVCVQAARHVISIFKLTLSLFVYFVLIIGRREMCGQLNCSNKVNQDLKHCLPIHLDIFWRSSSGMAFETAAKKPEAPLKSSLIKPSFIPLSLKFPINDAYHESLYKQRVS